METGKEKDRKDQGQDRIDTPKNRIPKNRIDKNRTPKDSISKNTRHERTYFILVSIFLAAILFYTLYIGELFWGIVIDILILRLYFLMKRERRYLREGDQNEEEAGIPHDPNMKRRIWVANMLVTLFVLGLVIYSYFALQFIWGVVAGLLILLYIHMLLFSGDNL